MLQPLQNISTILNSSYRTWLLIFERGY